MIDAPPLATVTIANDLPGVLGVLFALCALGLLLLGLLAVVDRHWRPGLLAVAGSLLLALTGLSLIGLVF